MMNCIHATRLLSESLERKLGVWERTHLRFHTMMCSGCRCFGEQAQQLREISRAYAPLGEDDEPGDKDDVLPDERV